MNLLSGLKESEEVFLLERRSLEVSSRAGVRIPTQKAISENLLNSRSPYFGGRTFIVTWNHRF